MFAGKLISEKDLKLAEIGLEKAKSNLSKINEIYSIYHLKGSIFPVAAPISGFVISKR
jgi:hypothetical protein